VIGWHGDGKFLAILNGQSVLYCEKHSWRVKHRFKNFKLRDEEFYTALAYSTNKKYMLVFTNLNKLIAYYIVNSEVVFEYDLLLLLLLFTSSPYHHHFCFVVLDKSLIVSTPAGHLIEVMFDLTSSLDHDHDHDEH
jgi:hypothetical protein